MPIVTVCTAHDARIAEYRSIGDGPRLRTAGLFVAEGRLVVRQLLEETRLQTRSLLITQAALQSLEDVVDDNTPFPVYVAGQSIVNDIVGFNIHRGCLGLGVRPLPISVAELIGHPAARMHTEKAAPDGSDGLPNGREGHGVSPVDASSVSRLVVLEAVSNVDNVGGIFRSVASLGGHAVMIGPGCGDPLYRKSIRTSIGATLRVPFATPTAWPEALHELRAAGFTIVALTPHPRAEPLEELASDLRARARVAVLVGAEGEGLSASALECADVHARIPMAPGIDSINVTVATAIALYRIA
jgi:tRNA G18 (ribose-2'-O)-methylase SpoU